MKKGILMAILVLTISILCVGCASWDRAVVDIKSDIGGGLNRTINVYTADGELMATYSGKIDLEMVDGGYVKFDTYIITALLKVLLILISRERGINGRYRISY